MGLAWLGDDCSLTTGTQEYKTKALSLRFNLKKNLPIQQDLVSGSLKPMGFVSLTEHVCGYTLFLACDWWCALTSPHAARI